MKLKVWIKCSGLMILIGVSFFLIEFTSAEDKPKVDHKAHKEETANEHGKHYEHKEGEGHVDHEGEEAEHEGHDEHGEEEGGEKNVGPEKGIMSFDERSGFKLSPEATKLFQITTHALGQSAPFILPESAILHYGEKTAVYRVRDGKYLKIDVTLERVGAQQVSVNSTQLKPLDQVVIKGVAHLRVGELDVTSGESGHHH